MFSRYKLNKGINQGNTLIKFSKTFYFTKPLK